MDKVTLIKANELDRKIKEFTEALNCFQWPDDYGGVSTNPRIVIEYDDGDGRASQPLPMNLSNELVEFLKREIRAARDNAVDEFNAL